MANLEFIDSFDHYDTATLNQKYNNPLNGVIVSTGGRFNGGYLDNPSGSGPAITFKSNITTVFAGCAIKFSGNFNAGNGIIFKFRDSGTDQVQVGTGSDGRLIILGPSGNIVATSTYALVTGSWYYIEAKALIDNASGVVEVKINEVVVVSFSGDTQSSSNNYCTNLWLCPNVPSGLSRIVDDFYIHKTAYLGDIKIGAIFPNAAGTHSAWTSTGANQWSVLDELAPNGDTDYIHTSGVNNKSSVNMQDVTLDGTCEGIQVLASARKDEANSRKIKTLIIEGGTETQGAEESISNNYYYTRDTYDVNPRTTLKWTDAELDAIEGGVILTA